MIAGKLQQLCNEEIEGAMVGIFRAPPIQGLGNAGGFKLQTEQHGYVDLGGLQTMTDQLIDRARADPSIGFVFTLYRAYTPQIFVDIDRAKVQSLQVPMQDVFNQPAGLHGRVLRQPVQQVRPHLAGQHPGRPRLADQCRHAQAALRPLRPGPGSGPDGALGHGPRAEPATGPLSVMRYNMYASAAVNGVPAPGVSSGTVVQQLTRIAQELDVPFEWTEMTFLQVQSGNVAFLIFGLGTVLVYLVLAAKYESWGLPLAVILVVPMCLLAAVSGMTIARLPVDIFVQIGFLVLVGMACKNAILIVEFAQEQWQQGEELHDAALGGARVRFRPIVMTSLAFIGGVFPLVIATGAGAEMRAIAGYGRVCRHDRRRPVRRSADAGIFLRPHVVPQRPADRCGVSHFPGHSGRRIAAWMAEPHRVVRPRRGRHELSALQNEVDNDSSSSKRVPTGPDGRDEVK